MAKQHPGVDWGSVTFDGSGLCIYSLKFRLITRCGPATRNYINNCFELHGIAAMPHTTSGSALARLLGSEVNVGHKWRTHAAVLIVVLALI